MPAPRPCIDRRFSVAAFRALLCVAAVFSESTLVARSVAVDPSSDSGWTQWRGPHGDGISREAGFLKRWPAKGLVDVWRIDVLGAGFSSFAAVGERLYSMGQAGGRQFLAALDAGSGKEIWRLDCGSAYQERQGGDGPRATPAAGAGRVHALGATGELVAAEAESGRLIWRVNVLEEFGAKNLEWGMSASPLLLRDLLVVAVGGKGTGVVAFDAATGKVRWRSQSDGAGDRAGYAAPYAFVAGGREQIAAFQARALVGLDPEDGAVLWSFPWRTSFDVNAAAPIHHEGHIFISSGYNHGSALLRLERGEAGWKAVEVWKSTVLRNKFSSSVLHEGHLYGFDENRLKCVELLSGREKWKAAGFGHGTLLLAGGHLIVLGDQGDLALALARPERYEEVARQNGVLRGGVSWTVPVLHRGRLYLRNGREAVCLDLRPAEAQAVR
jgi:outer membrane protein assembly factor BamB